jgi:hypothetical protein
MNRLQALFRALDSFGFEEQAAACRRLFDSGTIAFKGDSLLWQQWSIDVSGRNDEEASLDEYDTWMRSKSAALEAFESVGLPASPPPPLYFDELGDEIPAVGNSFTKVTFTTNITTILCFSPFA